MNEEPNENEGLADLVSIADEVSEQSDEDNSDLGPNQAYAEDDTIVDLGETGEDSVQK